MGDLTRLIFTQGLEHRIRVIRLAVVTLVATAKAVQISEQTEEPIAEAEPLPRPDVEHEMRPS